MIRCMGLIIFLLLASITAVQAAQSVGSESGQTKILVTFSDPAMGSASRVGTSRPGYKRGGPGYLVSLGVRRAASRIAGDFGLEVVDEWPILSLRIHCLVYVVPASVNVDDLLLRLQQDPAVDSAQLLNEFEASSEGTVKTGQSYASLQHSLDTLELVQAHRWSMGDNTTISIIDTGVDTDHPDLRAQISSQHDFVGDFVGQASQEASFNAHGTAVAGVIGADAENGMGIIGVAPASRLDILRACWHMPDRSSAVCNSFTLAKALDHAIGSNPDIINLSLAGPSDNLLGRLVRRALNEGIVVVAAAPEHPRSGFPADVEGVIVVGSSQHADSGQTRKPLQVRAPGTDILVPTPRGGYDYASGTSLSAAHVSGVAALLLASRPRLTADEVRNLLLESQSENHGTVNACRALAELLSESGCRTDPLVSQNQ